MFIALWGGVLVCEAILELIPLRNVADRRLVASLHYRIDMIAEGPFLAAILITGVLLLSEATWSFWLAVKVIGGLLVVAATAYCVVVVVQRQLAMQNATTDEEARRSFAKYTRAIYRISAPAWPLGVGVFALGWALS